MYLIYQESDKVRVSRSDGKLDEITGLYNSVAEIPKMQEEFQIVPPDVEKRKIKNYYSGNRPPKARG